MSGTVFLSLIHLFIGSPKRLVICSVGVYSDKATPTLWPDSFLLEVKTSVEGQTCRDTCMDKQLVRRNYIVCDDMYSVYNKGLLYLHLVIVKFKMAPR